MKNYTTRFAAWIVLAVMFIMLIPGISLRISSENKNNNVAVSVLYNSIANKISPQKLDEVLNELKDIGITTLSVGEDDLNFLVSKGEITSIKYNVLCHKYDAQSVEIARIIKEKCPNIAYDNHVVLINNEEKKEFFKYAVSRRYSNDECAYLGTIDGMDIYIFFDGRKQLLDFSLGYDESNITSLREKGFDIALVHKVKNYTKTGYLKDIDRLVKKYDIEFINLKSDAYSYPTDKILPHNYEGLSKIINNNDMTLVVTENPNQLSNQYFFGYPYILSNVISKNGSQKVLRSYETYDNSNLDESNYKYRTEQFFNSTIDRNIRFITVTLMEPANSVYSDCADYTIKSAKEYIEKIEAHGFTHTSQINKLDYIPNKRLNSAVCAVIMIMCALIAFQMVTGNKSFALVMTTLLIGEIAFVVSFFLPESLLLLYPTVYAFVHSCFAITVLLFFLKTAKDKFSLPILIVLSVAITVGTLLVGAIVQGALLSGISYYINDAIFRGIKLSLLVPVVYTAGIFYLMFMKNSNTKFLSDINKLMHARIKVYWLILGGILAAIGFYYILRSGNVSTISSFEQFARSFLTELFPARPRTKEFLIGYPSLVLLVYYVKRTDINIVKWVLAVATSILAASVSNSFCHVFTNFQTIVMRTINGLIVGIPVSFVAFFANIILIKIYNLICKRLKNTEMR